MASAWYFVQEGRQVGPVTSTQLKTLAATGRLKPTDTIWKEGMPKWVQARAIRGLFGPNSGATMATAAPPQSASEGQPTPEEEAELRRQQQEVEELRRAVNQTEQILEQLRAAQQGTSVGQTDDDPARPLDRHPVRYFAPDLVMKLPPFAWVLGNRWTGAAVLVAFALLLVAFVGGGMAIERQLREQGTNIGALLGAGILLLLTPIAFVGWGMWTSCPSCLRLWARLLHREHCVGRSRGMETVTRTDVHRDDHGNRFGTTERQEQVQVTRTLVRCEWVCRHCDHEWSTKHLFVSEN